MPCRMSEIEREIVSCRLEKCESLQWVAGDYYEKLLEPKSEW